MLDWLDSSMAEEERLAAGAAPPNAPESRRFSWK